MRCLVCDDLMKPLFSKRFESFGLGEVDYVECVGCGFVSSRTHAEMTDEAWEKLNASYHGSFHGTEHDSNDPAWVERLKLQADTLDLAASTGLLPTDRPWVDWGCGDAKLCRLLAARRGPVLKPFDRHARFPGYLSEAELRPGTFGFVLTTSVFEHLRDRRSLDEIANLVAVQGGVMGLHTLVAERVPADPAWFYLVPVHCAFFTNRSMAILCEQWGVRCSTYHPTSRLWFLFRDEPQAVAARVGRTNRQVPAGECKFVFKRGFVDYWKVPTERMNERFGQDLPPNG